jgi:mRNA interferase MazF
MKRGEVWWVNFAPSIGSEMKKQRPAVIISNDTANKHLNRVQVVPLSSRVERIYPCEAKVRFQGQEGKAMADQLTTVSKLRLVRKGGEVSAHEMTSIERAIRLQLAL